MFFSFSSSSFFVHYIILPKSLSWSVKPWKACSASTLIGYQAKGQESKGRQIRVGSSWEATYPNTPQYTEAAVQTQILSHSFLVKDTSLKPRDFGCYIFWRRMYLSNIIQFYMIEAWRVLHNWLLRGETFMIHTAAYVQKQINKALLHKYRQAHIYTYVQTHKHHQHLCTNIVTQ